MSDELKNVALKGIGKSPTKTSRKESDSDVVEPDEKADKVWKTILATEILDRGASPTEFWEKPFPEPAPEDDPPFCRPAAAKLLSSAAQEKKWKLLEEGFLLMNRTGKLLHPVALPTMLTALEEIYSQFPFAINTLGQRAAWLSGQNRPWVWLDRLIQPQIESSPGHPITLNQYIWRRHEDPVKANALLSDCWSSFDTQLQCRFLDLISKRPHSSDIPLLEWSLAARSSRLRRNALSTLLTLPNTSQSDAAIRLLQKILPDLWQAKSVSALSDELPFKWRDVTIYEKYFSNPLYRLLSTINPSAFQTILDMSPQAIMEGISGFHRERILQSIILASSFFQDKNWLLALSSFWLKSYPSDLTIGVDFVPVLSRLPAKLYNEMFRQIMEEEDHRYERLFILGSQNPHYINLKNSRQVIDAIFSLIQFDLKHNEKKYLIKWLEACGNQLDPRVYPYFNTKWLELEYYFMSLPKSLLQMSTDLAERHELYVKIVE